MIWYGQNEMKALLTTTSVVVAAALALGVGPASVTKDAEAAWKPKKPAELVIMARTGRAADRPAHVTKSGADINRCARDSGKPPGRISVRGIDDIDEVVWHDGSNCGGRFGCADIHVAIDERGVHADNLKRNAFCEL